MTEAPEHGPGRDARARAEALDRVLHDQAARWTGGLSPVFVVAFLGALVTLFLTAGPQALAGAYRTVEERAGEPPLFVGSKPVGGLDPAAPGACQRGDARHPGPAVDEDVFFH